MCADVRALRHTQRNKQLYYTYRHAIALEQIERVHACYIHVVRKRHLHGFRCEVTNTQTAES